MSTNSDEADFKRLIFLIPFTMSSFREPSSFYRTALLLLKIYHWRHSEILCSERHNRQRQGSSEVNRLMVMVNKFYSTGRVANMERCGRPSLQQTQWKVCQTVPRRINHIAVSRLSSIPQTSVHRILRQQMQLYPYQIHEVYSLKKTNKTRFRKYLVIY